MKEQVEKIKDLCAGDKNEQQLAQEILAKLVQDEFLLDSSTFITGKIYDLMCIEVSQGFYISEMSDVWLGSCFARITIIRHNGVACIPLVAEKSEIEMNNAYQAVANLAERILSVQKRHERRIQENA